MKGLRKDKNLYFFWVSNLTSRGSIVSANNWLL
jgi:hypothetical protein